MNGNEREIAMLQWYEVLQRDAAVRLTLHRRMVASNKVLSKANREQREIALRERSDEELFALAKSAAPSTVARYRTRAAGAYKEAQAAGESVWQLVEERSGNLDSWYTFKAGVQHYLEEETVRVKSLLFEWHQDRTRNGDSPESNATGKRLVWNLAEVVDALALTPTQAPERFKSDGKSKRYSTHSKSKSIRSAPEGWRERAANAMQGNLKVLFLIQCVTGCRPQELANGAQVRLLRDGTLVTRVRGAKTDEFAGQPIRGMRLDASTGAAKMLAELAQVGVTLNSRRCGIGQVNTYAKNVSRACARVFPERKGRRALSAYSVRHQFKADLVAAGWTRAEIAMAMGHSSTRSGTAYGRGGRGGRGAVKPIAIKAQRPVRLRGGYPGEKSEATAATTVQSAAPRKNRPRP